MSRILSKILNNIDTKYIVGSKEVLKKIDNVKLIVSSNTVDKRVKAEIESICKDKGIPIYNINNTSIELAKLCNKPFRVSILALTQVNSNDLESLLKEINSS